MHLSRWYLRKINEMNQKKVGVVSSKVGVIFQNPAKRFVDTFIFTTFAPVKIFNKVIIRIFL